MARFDSSSILRIVLASIAGVAACAFFPFPRDDAYITFRYAERLAEGLGFTYQSGSAVQGTSTPLWTFLLASVHRLGGAVGPWAASIGILSHALSVGLLIRLGERAGDRRAGFVAGALLALNPPSVAVAASGMETAFATALLLGAVAATLEAVKASNPSAPSPAVWRERRWSALAGALAGLLVLTRLDLAPAAALMALVCFRLPGRRIPWWGLLAGSALVVPWLGWAHAYFGTVVPHTVTAKLSFYDAADAWRQPSITVSWFMGDPLRAGLSALALVGAARLVRRDLRWLALPAWIVGYFLLLDSSGTWVHEWYRTPPIPLFYLLVAGGALKCTDRLITLVGPEEGSRGWNRWHRNTGFAAVAGGLSAGALLLPSAHHAWADATERWLGAHGEVGRWLGEHVVPGEQVACGDIGLIGYRSGAQILDWVGLVSPEALPHHGATDVTALYRSAEPAWAVVGTYGPDWATLLSDPWFRRHYRERFRRPYAPEVEYRVFQRQP